MSSIALNGVGLIYPGGTIGLHDVDLRVSDGEFVALVGASGSGKTTLLRTIAGFIAPTAGTIRLGEDIVAGPGVFLQPEHRQLGMVFQQHAIWPHWTVGQNVAYPLRLARVPRPERRARLAEVLDLVGLPGFEARDPATLSGGQRQRVALARALAGSPRVLLLDEALSALDEPLRDRLRLDLRTLTRSIGLTVVHVTHDRDEALALADRVVVLDDGRLQQVGTPDELVDRPTTAFVARFLSDATVMRGTVIGASFEADGHPLRVPRAALLGRAEKSGAGSIAILPGDVQVRPARDGEPHGIVVSSLYDREASDVVVTWNGIDIRCSVPGSRPSVGERVSLDVRRAHYYDDDRASLQHQEVNA